MEFIVMFTILIIGLMGLDVAALNWGADSRAACPMTTPAETRSELSGRGRLETSS